MRIFLPFLFYNEELTPKKNTFYYLNVFKKIDLSTDSTVLLV